MSDLFEFDLADILAASREYIEKNGWSQGEFVLAENEYDEEGEEVVSYEILGYCAMGGVLYSQGIEENECATDPRSRAVAFALCEAIDLDTVHYGSCDGLGGICGCVINWVTTWNDDDLRTEQDVLDAFMKAEKNARGGNVDE
jgi:hypothetical protein